MEIVPIKIIHGEDKAWQTVCDLSRQDVCSRTAAAYDEKAGVYSLRCFGTDFHVNPCEMMLSCPAQKAGQLFLGKLKDFFRLSVLCYMSSAKDISLTGKLVRPVDVKGGHRFSAGTHVLPLDAIAEKYASDSEGFVRAALEFGGEELGGYGDAYVRLYPLPRVPVTMVLWLRDEEFSPKVDLFFDSTCEYQLPLSDIIWAVAMMSCIIMLEG